MLGQVPQWLVDVGAAAAALAAVIVLGQLLVRLFVSAVREVIEDAVAPIRAEVQTNGGSSLKDVVKQVRDGLEGEKAERQARQEVLDSRLDQVVERLDLFQPVLDEWRRSHPEVRP